MLSLWGTVIYLPVNFSFSALNVRLGVLVQADLGDGCVTTFGSGCVYVC